MMSLHFVNMISCECDSVVKILWKIRGIKTIYEYFSFFFEAKEKGRMIKTKRA